MRRNRTRALALILTAVMLAGMMALFARPVSAVDASTADVAPQTADQNEQMRASVEEQIRAFAKSINQTNADDAAAKALAKHGLGGKGKKLSVGKNHALTATLWNSELLQVAAIETCTATIEYMQELDQDYLPYVNGGCIWKSEGHSSYGAAVYTADDIEPEHCVVNFLGSRQYTGTRNAYDSSLDWMAGTTGVKMSFQVKKVTADSITYSVTYSIWDRFDFSTSSNSNFKNLISAVGAILFREFDWESKVTFELTVPYSCIHNSGKYHWSYDPESHLLISDSTDGYTENKTIQHTFTPESGQIQYYHKLEKTIRLRHDKPWVMEYTTRKPGNFVIAPLEVFSRQQLLFSHCGNVALMLRQRSDDVYNNYDYYGIQYDKQPSRNGTYTFRLENVIDAQGNNMIYLTIINADSQAVVLSKSPMDGYYEFVDSVWILKSSPSDYLNGIDLFVNYIGNYNNRFHADYFDLRIWENGIDGGDGDYFTSKVTAPTCAAKGYTTHTCSCCGYSYKDTYTAKTDHKFGSWKKTASPTCVGKGTETRTCSGCGATETRATAALGHSHTPAVTAPTCTEKGFTTYTCHCGDTYTDSYVDALGHTMGEWVETEAPTCTAAGSEKRECANCDHTETHATAALGHSHTPAVTAPTCTEKGFTTYTCHCGDTYTDSYVDALGHTMGDWVETKAPTCTEKGSEQRDCGNCDYTETREVAATGHTLTDWIIDREPAPGVEGSKHKECEVCGETLETAVIEALPEVTEPETETEPDTESDTEPETEPETELETESDTESEIEPETEFRPTETRPTQGTLPEIETESETEPAAEKPEQPKKKGCASTVQPGMLLLMMVLLPTMAVRREKERE